MKKCLQSIRRVSVAAVGFLCAGSAIADVNVGVILSQTGSAAAIGISQKATMAKWPTEVAGQKLNYILLDDASDPTSAALAAKKLTLESKVDAIIGPSLTPTSMAALQVIGDTQTPMISLAGGSSVIVPQEGPKKWAFKMPPGEDISITALLKHMKKNGIHRLAMFAVSNPLGETCLDVVKKLAPEYGVELVDVERFNATDTGVASQAIKAMGAKPDAVFIVAANTPALLPQIDLKNKGYKGQIYQFQSAANAEFLRLGGKDVEGTVLSGSPLLVATQLPKDHPVKNMALAYVKLFEQPGATGASSIFAPLTWDAINLLQKALPKAIKQATPGTPEFRKALRDSIESTKGLVLSQGVHSMSETDHSGADHHSQVLIKIAEGKWQYID